MNSGNENKPLVAVEFTIHRAELHIGLVYTESEISEQCRWESAPTGNPRNRANPGQKTYAPRRYWYTIDPESMIRTYWRNDIWNP